jgi:hypothetical protein
MWSVGQLLQVSVVEGESKLQLGTRLMSGSEPNYRRQEWYSYKMGLTTEQALGYRYTLTGDAQSLD